MKTWTASIVGLLVLSAAVSVVARQLTADEREALRARLVERYDVVPLSDAIGLRPKARTGDVRLIEVSDAVAINGVTVSGRELRERVGADADAILRLSYLDAETRQALFAEPAPVTEPALEQPAVAPPVTPGAPEAQTRRQRVSGDRVRIFGSIVVPANESLSGQAVAVMGSVRVDGEVGDQVVAVMGSVNLGPTAIVRGDVVAIGGRINRAPGAQVRGGETEVSLGGVFSGPRRSVHVPPPWAGAPWHGLWFDGFGAVPRLLGSTFRLLLLALLVSIALLVARPVVEAAAERVSDTPVHTTLVGLVAVLLLGPVLFLTSMILVISIVGLPLLALIPFLLVALLLMALAGFSGTAYAIGQWARRRLGLTSTSPFLDGSLGVLVILLPLLLGRIVALAGWPAGPVAMLLVVTGFGVEFLAWSSGFGAVLANGFGRWQARRATRAVATVPAAEHPGAPPPNAGP